MSTEATQTHQTHLNGLHPAMISGAIGMRATVDNPRVDDRRQLVSQISELVLANRRTYC